MRGLFGAALALLLFTGRPAVAECSTEDEFREWMRWQWPGASVEVYEAGADTLAISEGIKRASGPRIAAEGRFVVCRSPDYSVVRGADIVGGCFVGRLDVDADLFDQWLERSKL